MALEPPGTEGRRSQETFSTATTRKQGSATCPAQGESEEHQDKQFYEGSIKFARLGALDAPSLQRRARRLEYLLPCLHFHLQSKLSAFSPCICVLSVADLLYDSNQGSEKARCNIEFCPTGSRSTTISKVYSKYHKWEYIK